MPRRAVTDGDPLGLDATTRPNRRQQIAAARGNEAARAYIQGRRKQYKAPVADDRL